MVKEEYERAEIEIIRFENGDVLTNSGQCNNYEECEYELPRI